MTYELRGGERGSYVLTGVYSTPLRVAGAAVAGFVFAAILKFEVGRQTRYFDPSNEYFPFSMLLLLVVALGPPVVILWADRRENISLSVDTETREVRITWRALMSVSEESFAFTEVADFRLQEVRLGGSMVSWYMYLRRPGADEIVVAKFRAPHDAERECEEANRSLLGTKTNWKLG